MPKPSKITNTESGEPPEREVRPSPGLERPQRRSFTAPEKRQILKGAEAAKTKGKGCLGEFLRKEGIYHSHLQTWRKQFEREGLAGLAGRQPGRKPCKDLKDRRIEELEKENRGLRGRLELAQKLIDLQRKAHEVLGLALPRAEDK